MTEQNKIKKGAKAPSFTLSNQDGGKVSLKNFLNKYVVLYFYPRDNTSGCTLEAQDFSARSEDFKKLNAVILGISPDNCQSHQKFILKYDLGITLLSDPEKKVLEKYGVWQIKKMYGKESFGVVRSTFLISPDGKIADMWTRVKVDGHADKVMLALVEHQKRKK